MKKIILSFSLAIIILVFLSGGLFAQTKGKVHIKITDDDKKIDTVIEFKDNIDPEKIKSIVSMLAGEDIDVDIHKKGYDKMLWISDDFDFHYDFDFDFDSLFKEFNTLKFDDLSDSILLKHGIIRDSADSFIFKGDDEFVTKWHSNDTVKGKNKNHHN